MPGLTGVTQLTGGYQHACARRGDGTVWCWGSNSNAQCGLPTSTASVFSPRQIAGIGDAEEVVAGEFFTCVRRADASVWCWGNNDSGQLGEDATQFVSSPTPTRVAGAEGATSLAAGAAHACARLGDGTVRCWGSFHYGSLGIGHIFAARF